MKRSVIIAVIGGSKPDRQCLTIAEQVGKIIAKRNAILITGGMGGVMSAASKGAKSAQGLVIGVLPGTGRQDANPDVDVPIITGMGEARNVIIARTCDCAIAIDGKYGTLSEIAYCLLFNKPVIGINTWDFDDAVIKAQSADEAVAMALQRVSS